MKVKGFNRVELIVREDQIQDAVKQFNELLGLKLPKPISIANPRIASRSSQRNCGFGCIISFSRAFSWTPSPSPAYRP